MKTFEFSIIASGLDPHADGFEDKFYSSGCDDALVSFQKGHIIVDFAREADSIAEAIASAVENVCATGAKIDRIEPDPLVNLNDIAARTDMTRAAISNYAKGTRGKDFPSPVARVTSDAPLYDWAEVANWMALHRKIPAEVAVSASVFQEANKAIEEGEFHLSERLKKRAQEEEDALEAA
jgi:predicted DNA-binding transcriptional regulator AlpA